MSKKEFGSGYFGEWIRDEFGLPAYKYTCDQLNDEKAISPVNEIWRSKTDHSHQIGNDRLVGVCSNYGYVLVRQDEGSPKFLNDYDPNRYQYGGGIGYLIENENLISTFYKGDVEIFERIFGMGYFRKIVKNKGLKVDQIIYAPYGNDPVLISQVVIENNRESEVELNWIEYWGCTLYQFSYKAFILGLVSKLSIPEIRRRNSRRFKQKFEIINDENEKEVGILCDNIFLGTKFSDKLKWGLLNFLTATLARNLTGGAIIPPVKQAALEDKNPPKIFLVSLKEVPDKIFTNAKQFFGEGGVLSPNGLNESIEIIPDYKPFTDESGLFIEHKFKLKPGEKKTLYFMYGYLPEGYELKTLIEKYNKNIENLFEKSCQNWNKNIIQLEIKDKPWVNREVHWHNYYLRSNLTYDSFFKEHILSQGHVYQYLIGFQGASRDPCQHALPFIFTDPNIVKEIIRYTLKTVHPNGMIPYGIVGHGMIQPAPFKPSDLQLWILWLTSEYVLAWRDLEFLNEIIPLYPVYGKKAKKMKIKEILDLCYNYFINEIGAGSHNLQRLSNGDWNDMVVHGYVPRKKHKDVKKYAESVLNSAMAVYVLYLYSKMLKFIGENNNAKRILNRIEILKDAIKRQWTGNWFKRAWLSKDLGWVGEDILWLEPQPWTIIGRITNEEQNEKLIKTINKELRAPSKIGAMIMNKPLEHTVEAEGMGTNAGIWLSINGTLIWALALYNGELAWDEWEKNTLAKHADEYPEIWYGIWSGPDTYNSIFSKYPGATIFSYDLEKSEGGFLNIDLYWTDFPVMNMHPHAWPLYTIAKLIGVEFHDEGLDLNPVIPYKEYAFKSKLLGLEKNENGYEGWYNPNKKGSWKINIKLDKSEIDLIEYIEINGKKAKFDINKDVISFKGDSDLNKPFHWKIVKQ
ncbi:MAG: GH36-type glycosyl hydrolase domain-containing protein [Candidatus Helarchaeota archaeon]